MFSFCGNEFSRWNVSHDKNAVMQEACMIVLCVYGVTADEFTSYTCGYEHLELDTDLKSEVKKSEF